jgi:hypothetical protein
MSGWEEGRGHSGEVGRYRHHADDEDCFEKREEGQTVEQELDWNHVQYGDMTAKTQFTSNTTLQSTADPTSGSGNTFRFEYMNGDRRKSGMKKQQMQWKKRSLRKAQNGRYRTIHGRIRSKLSRSVRGMIAASDTSHSRRASMTGDREVNIMFNTEYNIELSKVLPLLLRKMRRGSDGTRKTIFCRNCN